MVLIGQSSEEEFVKRAPLLIAGLGLAALLTTLPPEMPARLIWNRSGSLPEGLYWQSNAPFGRGDIVAVSAGSEAAQWSASRGFTGRNWPLLKRVAGVPGDEICREGAEIFINGERAGAALSGAQNGVVLPVWTGCRRLTEGEVFLMNPHPRSLDGRYFGVTAVSDIDGRVVEVRCSLSLC